LFLTSALYGLVIVGSAFRIEAFVTLALTSITLIYFWCRFDAAARSVSLPTWNQVLIIAVALIGVPVYFFRTRSRRDAALATLKAAVVLGGTGIVSAVCQLIARQLIRALAT